MVTRAFAFGLWAAVAASAVFWGLKLFVKPLETPAFASVAATAASPRGDLSRLLGADVVPVAAVAAPEAPEQDRFELIGVVAPRPGTAPGQGVALIAVDGKAPRAYRVGAVIDGDTVLQRVDPRGASLGPRGGDALVSLDLPPPAPAATGVPQPGPAATGVPQPAPGALPAPPRAPLPPAAGRPMPRASMQLPRQLMAPPAEAVGEPEAARSDSLQRE
jgi:general secretion pathway protein C